MNIQIFFGFKIANYKDPTPIIPTKKQVNEVIENQMHYSNTALSSN